MTERLRDKGTKRRRDEEIKRPGEKKLIVCVFSFGRRILSAIYLYPKILQ